MTTTTMTSSTSSCLKKKSSPPYDDDDAVAVVTRNNNVSFSEVTVFEFPVAMGDNPACSHGCPIALGGFEYVSKMVEDFDIYMYDRLSAPKRRTRKGLLITADVRTQMLISAGYDFTQVVQGTSSVLEIQQLRNDSLQKSSWEDVKSFFGNKRFIPKTLLRSSTSTVLPAMKKKIIPAKSA
jgi:hypothetical protein